MDNRQKDRLMDRQTDGHRDVWMDGWTDRRTDRRTDGRIDEWTNAKSNKIGCFELNINTKTREPLLKRNIQYS
jgi:hypothetical protein